MERHNKNTGRTMFSSFIWAFLERSGAQGVGLIVNIILARLLLPEDYGVLAIMVIFTSLANQIVLNGFNTSLIQNKDVTDEDYSSVLYVSLMVSAALYALIFSGAPLIADFYDTPALIFPLRILALVLFPGSLQSVQTAKLRRELDFKTLCYLTVLSSISGGIVGIILAFCGGGVWALVAQQLIGSISTCVVLWIKLGWRPRAVINWTRVRILFSYGWKILAASLLNTLFTDITGLIIGKKYTPTMLAYYDKGKMLPQKLLQNINGSIQGVMLPALANEQGDIEKCKQMMRRSIQISCFIIFPMMAGLAAVSKPVIIILLTDKWLPCVPFMQLTCLIYASNPIAIANLQAINALGRSDVYLKLEVIKKIMEITTLIITVTCFNSALAILCGTAVTMPLGLLINALPNKKIVGYSFGEQIRDILPALLLSLFMFGAVYAVSFLSMSMWLMLIVQIFLGVVIYAGGAALFKLEGFYYLLNLIKPVICRVFHR